VVRQGAEKILEAFGAAIARGERMVVVDALTDDQLRDIGTAAASMKLITGGSGIAIGLPANFRQAGTLAAATGIEPISAPDGAAIMMAGSCSAATRRQVKVAEQAGVPTFKIDPVDIRSGEISEAGVLAWIRNVGGVPLVYSSTEPDEVRNAQEMLGRDRAGEIVEQFFARLATQLRDRGTTRFLVAGGETSGAVVHALGVRAMQIGQEIDPGVPWTRSIGDDRPLALALKSGNFGADDFLIKAWDRLR
jgi:uncharacterized protein YgbK (DUF1537 family)